MRDIVMGIKGPSLAITEPSGDSDVARMKTTARKDGTHYIINGSKAFITGSMKSHCYVVGARTGGDGLGSISLFIVEVDADGFSRTAMDQKMVWWVSDQAMLYFDDVRVSTENMLGDENRGFIQIMQNFNYERMGMVADMLSIMKILLKESIERAQQRETFGKPLMRHQVIRHKIADMSARIDQIESYLIMIFWQANEGDVPVVEISKAKFSASKALEFCASEAMQILGDAGYLRDNPVGRIYREVKVNAIGGGSEEIMRDLAIKQMEL